MSKTIKTERIFSVRNCLAVLISGSLLGGCLSAEESVSPSENDAASFSSLNTVPLIAGNPPSAVLHGEMYDFQPTATDPDGDALEFHIAGKPDWAEFDETTGRLFGIPTLGHVGTYENIEISAHDESASVALRTFSITVSQAALGAVTLSWLPPTENVDGSPLLDLAGYRIFYGTRIGIFDHEIHIANAGITTYVVENLAPGTYYFAASSINSSGSQSAYSAQVSRTVD